MNTPIRILLLVASLWFAGSSFAQSPTPNPNAGTYKDGSLSVPQRVPMAMAVVTGTSTDEAALFDAAYFALTARPVLSLFKASPGFAESVVDDPSLGGRVMDAGRLSLLTRAGIFWKVTATPSVDDALAYIKDRWNLPAVLPPQLGELHKRCAELYAAKYESLMAAGKYAEAANLILPMVTSDTGVEFVARMARAKMLAKAPDALSWARLGFLFPAFSHTQEGIDLVSNALRILDNNSFSRSTAWVAYLKTGVGPNPLDGIPFPQGFQIDSPNPYYLHINACIRGDNAAAIKDAYAAYATAGSGKPINAAADVLAMTLRNADGNLVRANAFIAAQAKGEPFNIAELAQ